MHKFAVDFRHRFNPEELVAEHFCEPRKAPEFDRSRFMAFDVEPERHTPRFCGLFVTTTTPKITLTSSGRYSGGPSWVLSLELNQERGLGNVLHRNACLRMVCRPYLLAPPTGALASAGRR